MQLAIVSNGLRVISRGTTDGNALACSVLTRRFAACAVSELMAEVGGGMEEDRDGGSGGNPSAGRRRHGPKR